MTTSPLLLDGSKGNKGFPVGILLLSRGGIQKGKLTALHFITRLFTSIHRHGFQ